VILSEHDLGRFGRQFRRDLKRRRIPQEHRLHVRYAFDPLPGHGRAELDDPGDFVRQGHVTRVHHAHASIACGPTDFGDALCDHTAI
jgi:hypothetical protein